MTQPRALWYKANMTRGFALWAGLAAAVAVVVAGITIAMFPPEPKVAQPQVIVVPSEAARPPAVPLSVRSGVAGTTTSAPSGRGTSRGGAATPTPGGADTGVVAIAIPAKPAPIQHSTAPQAQPVGKSFVPRPTSIGATSASNSDAGLASAG
jgi:hypothetical protein